MADEKELVGSGEVGFKRLGQGRGRKTVGKETEGVRAEGRQERRTHSASDERMGVGEREVRRERERERASEKGGGGGAK